VKRLPRLMPEPSSSWIESARPCLRSISFDLERLLEADGPAQAMRADLQEDLVRDVVARAEEQPGKDLRKGA
jgi:hypothetical protein